MIHIVIVGRTHLENDCMQMIGFRPTESILLKEADTTEQFSKKESLNIYLVFL